MSTSAHRPYFIAAPPAPPLPTLAASPAAIPATIQRTPVGSAFVQMGRLGRMPFANYAVALDWLQEEQRRGSITLTILPEAGAPAAPTPAPATPC